VLGVAVLLGLAYAVDHARGVGQGTLTASTPIVVRAPGGDLRTTAADLGLTVDGPASRRALDDARSSNPIDWVRGLFGQRRAGLVTRVDEAKATALVRASDPTTRKEPVEPAVVGTDDGLEVRDGKPGRGLDPVQVIAAVQVAAGHGGPTVEAKADPVRLPPRHSRAEAEALARRAEQLTGDELVLTAGEATTTVSSSTLRSWIHSDDDLQIDVDADEVQADLARLLAGATRPAQDATIRIEGGRPVIVPGVVGLRCCGPGAADAVRTAVLRGRSSASVPLRDTQPDRTSDDLRKLEIVEQVGTFTTRHPAGQPRVTNIHRIADLMDGTIIGPGGRLSVNTKIGERTTEKGFVVDHSIADGKFVETVGGGISQFATTLFNAAFFAGLDLPTYQAHSIYISRYPYGREATLSWPKPDLVISNTTPYGVLVDTSYTGSSLTVTLWSTRYATGEQTNQTTSPAGQCTRVKTERTRRYVDGHTKVDYVYATYRPAEGVQC
jgi:vancomycin resistance protein YoaR